jgi:hypothetical protein
MNPLDSLHAKIEDTVARIKDNFRAVQHKFKAWHKGSDKVFLYFAVFFLIIGPLWDNGLGGMLSAAAFWFLYKRSQGEV